MKQVYLWEDYIPSNLNPLKEPDPVAFFNKMVYKTEDRWSWITEDYPSLLAQLQGTPISMGISPAFGLVGSSSVVLIVEFVYPDSPAADAGLKRGDLIVKINGTLLNVDNYYTLYSLSSYTAETGTINTSLEIEPSGNTVSLTQRVIETNPVIYHGILSIEGIKTGYIVYSEFIGGIDGKFNNALGELCDDFKAEGVSEIIFDLRYNPGGEINTAAYIASLLAPASVVNSNEVLVSYLYNSGYQEYFTTGEGADLDRLKITFPANPHNLDLNRVLFLTSRGSASASELIIIGLDPYMEVIQIGENTHGKYTGAWVIPDNEEPARHNYAFIPSVMKYSNADNCTNFMDGLIADYEVVDVLGI
jgi:C-terminal processing protease CtpA/Prc